MELSILDIGNDQFINLEEISLIKVGEWVGNKKTNVVEMKNGGSILLNNETLKFVSEAIRILQPKCWSKLKRPKGGNNED